MIGLNCKYSIVVCQKLVKGLPKVGAYQNLEDMPLYISTQFCRCTFAMCCTNAFLCRYMHAVAAQNIKVNDLCSHCHVRIYAEFVYQGSLQFSAVGDPHRAWLRRSIQIHKTVCLCCQEPYGTVQMRHFADLLALCPPGSVHLQPCLETQQSLSLQTLGCIGLSQVTCVNLQ